MPSSRAAASCPRPDERDYRKLRRGARLKATVAAGEWQKDVTLEPGGSVTLVPDKG